MRNDRRRSTAGCAPPAQPCLESGRTRWAAAHGCWRRPKIRSASTCIEPFSKGYVFQGQGLARQTQRTPLSWSLRPSRDATRSNRSTSIRELTGLSERLVSSSHHFLNNKIFVDAVAVVMIAPDRAVITVRFICYLTARLPATAVTAFAIFIPCYLFTIIPVPYFKGTASCLTSSLISTALWWQSLAQLAARSSSLPSAPSLI